MLHAILSLGSCNRIVFLSTILILSAEFAGFQISLPMLMSVVHFGRGCSLLLISLLLSVLLHLLQEFELLKCLMADSLPEAEQLRLHRLQESLILFKRHLAELLLSCLLRWQVLSASERRQEVV